MTVIGTGRPACASGSAAMSGTAPRHVGGVLGDRQAAWGLLRDQIRSCVPFSPSIKRA